MNQNQIFFNGSQINKAVNYKINFNDNQLIFESILNSTIIDGFNWEKVILGMYAVLISMMRLLDVLMKIISQLTIYMKIILQMLQY